MSTVRLEAVSPSQAAGDEQLIPMQPASQDIWDKKYRLKTKQGEPVDADIDGTYQRVAKALADAEPIAGKAEVLERALPLGAAPRRDPAGRITSNAGALEHKPATSTINCTVSGTIDDSMDGILDKVHEAGLTLKAGCGIGYEFSTLRPRGAFVAGAGAYTSGPMSFMDIYDKMCFTVSSAGGRRGAQMGTFDVSPSGREGLHPRQARRRPPAPVQPVAADHRRLHGRGQERRRLAAGVPDQPEGRARRSTSTTPSRSSGATGPRTSNYVSREDGLVACKIYGHIRARHLWDMIMVSTYDYAEPGFILIDRVNEMNNNWWCENIRATNPCGEQPLPPYGACLLGSVNLTSFVRNPFTDQATFDWDEYKEVVRVFTRMLDNVVEVNGLPLQQQRDEILRKRRHGMGFLGLGSTVTMLQMKYGSKASLRVHRAHRPRDGRRRLGNGPGAGQGKRPRADHGRAVRGHRRDAAPAPGNGEGRLAPRPA